MALDQIGSQKKEVCSDCGTNIRSDSSKYMQDNKSVSNVKQNSCTIGNMAPKLHKYEYASKMMMLEHRLTRVCLPGGNDSCDKKDGDLFTRHSLEEDLLCKRMEDVQLCHRQRARHSCSAAGVAASLLSASRNYTSRRRQTTPLIESCEISVSEPAATMQQPQPRQRLVASRRLTNSSPSPVAPPVILSLEKLPSDQSAALEKPPSAHSVVLEKPPSAHSVVLEKPSSAQSAALEKPPSAQSVVLEKPPSAQSAVLSPIKPQCPETTSLCKRSKIVSEDFSPPPLPSPPEVCDLSPEELAAYFEEIVQLPRKMSAMAEMMYA